jgi:hypothetical protein
MNQGEKRNMASNKKVARWVSAVGELLSIAGKILYRTLKR